MVTVTVLSLFSNVRMYSNLFLLSFLIFIGEGMKAIEIDKCRKELNYIREELFAAKR